MRILIVSSRPPWPPHSGDRARCLLWLDALHGHEVLLATPGGPLDVRRTPAVAVRAAAGALTRGLPLHTLLAAGDWFTPLGKAGEFDAAVVLLTRTDPWVFPHLRARRLVLDAIDSATFGMRERARAASGLARAFWSGEARRCAALEASAGTRYDTIVAVTRRELEPFGAGEVVPMGIAIGPEPAEARTTDFAFWGRLAYFANEHAAKLLLRDLWPRIRALRPRATLLVGGAEAPRWIRVFDGRDGIRVVSPLGDAAAELRRVKVALLPVAFGSGQSMKTLEAAEAGCAIAGTSLAMRGCEALSGDAVVEDDMGRLAERAVALLDDTAELARRARAGRAAVAAIGSRETALAAMRRLLTGAPHG